MSPFLGLIAILLALAALVIWLVWQNARLNKVEAWPVTEGTIQSVGTVVVHAGRGAYCVDVGDFSYNVDDEYYSGRLAISPSFSAGDRSPKGLVNQRIKVRFNPQKPQKFSVPRTEVGGFLLGPYYEPVGEDIDPIDLNIDKV